MKRKRMCLSIIALMALAISSLSYSLNLPSAQAQETVVQQDLPHVVILATGGTIASTAASNTDTSNYQVTDGVGTLINAVPEIKDIANVSGEQVINISSQNISDENRLTLGKRINELLAKDDVDGIVVTHGTETLEQTAYFLNLIVKSDKPVVVVGSMRPASAISADGPLNLYNAVKVAGDPQSKDKGVLIVFNDRIGSARFISKTSSWATDTFKSLEQGFLGDIVAGKVRFYQQPLIKHTYQTDFDISELSALPKVDILYESYASSSLSLLNASIEDGAQGVILAGWAASTADEQMQKIAAKGISDAEQNQIEYLTKLIKEGSGAASWAQAQLKQMEATRGAVLVKSFYQATGQKLYEQDSFVESNSLNPQKARILLQLALTNTTDPDKIQQYFDEY
ncbi:type II asparaginase [Candidatus Pristimantibacillus sp. PTI5]|uniref:type II asparaginase n=1 Tax=Candidatus Pristimantibacillus sp. PTI5 TaxID=3400422 RepID=UPI003B02E231